MFTRIYAYHIVEKYIPEPRTLHSVPHQKDAMRQTMDIYPTGKMQPNVPNVADLCHHILNGQAECGALVR